MAWPREGVGLRRGTAGIVANSADPAAAVAHANNEQDKGNGS